MRAESSAASAALECFRLNAAADLLKRAVVVAADADLPGEIENDLNAATGVLHRTTRLWGPRSSCILLAELLVEAS